MWQRDIVLRKGKAGGHPQNKIFIFAVNRYKLCTSKNPGYSFNPVDFGYILGLSVVYVTIDGAP